VRRPRVDVASERPGAGDHAIGPLLAALTSGTAP
jgi:hypothetical protein